MESEDLIIVIRQAWDSFLEEPSEYAVEQFKRLLLPHPKAEVTSAVDRLMLDRGRKKPPTPPEIIDEMRAERRRREQKKHHEALMIDDRNLPSDETIARQKAEARAKYPWLYE